MKWVIRWRLKEKMFYKLLYELQLLPNNFLPSLGPHSFLILPPTLANLPQLLLSTLLLPAVHLHN